MNDNWVRLGDVIKKILEEYLEDEPDRPLITEYRQSIEREMQGGCA